MPACHTRDILSDEGRRTPEALSSKHRATGSATATSLGGRAFEHQFVRNMSEPLLPDNSEAEALRMRRGHGPQGRCPTILCIVLTARCGSLHSADVASDSETPTEVIRSVPFPLAFAGCRTAHVFFFKHRTKRILRRGNSASSKKATAPCPHGKEENLACRVCWFLACGDGCDPQRGAAGRDFESYDTNHIWTKKEKKKRTDFESFEYLPQNSQVRDPSQWRRAAPFVSLVPWCRSFGSVLMNSGTSLHAF